MESPNSQRSADHQFTLRTLLLAVVAVAATLGAWSWFGVQGGLAAVAAALTLYAGALRGLRAVVSPNGLTWLSGLVTLFSGFQVYAIGPMGGEIRLFAFLAYLDTTEPLHLALTWLMLFSLIGFGLLAGAMAFVHIVCHAPWAWRRAATLAFLGVNTCISGLALIPGQPVADEATRLLLFVFAMSLSGILLIALFWKSRVAAPRQVALADAIAVVSVLLQHVPLEPDYFHPDLFLFVLGRWMLLAGSAGILAASVWLWFRDRSTAQA